VLLIGLCELHALALVMILTIGYLGCVFGLVSAPTMALLTDLTERTEFAAVIPSAQLIAFSLGDLVGSSAGAALAQATRDAATYATLAVLSLGALLAFRATLVRQRQIAVVEDRRSPW